MTREQASRMQGLINVLAEAEREYVRAKLRFTSNGRRDACRSRLKSARADVKKFISEATQNEHE